MAQITASNQPIELDLAGGTSFKTLVCLTTATWETTNEVTEEETDCGTLTSVGPMKVSVSGDGLCETAPTVSQISYGAMLAAQKAGNNVTLRIQNPTVIGSSLGTSYFITCPVKITNMSAAKPSPSGYVTWSFTIQSDGNVDVTP
jgi:hypothetical protein